MTKPANLSFCKETVKLVKELVLNFLTLGERLHKVYHEDLWQAEGYGSWEEFLQEVELSRGSASKLIAIHEKLVVGWNFPRGKLSDTKAWTKLYSVASRAKTKAEAERLLLEAQTLTSRDLELKGRDEPECEHDLYELRLRCCRRCAYKERVYDEAVA